MTEPPYLLVKFPNSDDIRYVTLVMRRKGLDLGQYILSNFEWDEMPECIAEGKTPKRKICKRCEYEDRCPDAVAKKDGKVKCQP